MSKKLDKSQDTTASQNDFVSSVPAVDILADLVKRNGGEDPFKHVFAGPIEDTLELPIDETSNERTSHGK